MGQAIKIVLAFVISWMYYFPLVFIFLPSSINSKILVAFWGLICFCKEQVQHKRGIAVDKSMVWMFALAAMFSIACYASVVFNGTDTKDYTTYIVSMLVWLCGAYGTCYLIKYAHGKVTVELLGQYIIAICVLQGILSFAFYVNSDIYNFFSQYFHILSATSKSGTRLFGLGASSDTGGVKYAIALLFLSYLICKFQTNSKNIYIYSICFLIITILGNMMARTTTVGVLLGIGYLIVKSNWININEYLVQPIGILLKTLLFSIPLLLIFNFLFPQTNELYDFAFEGFVNFSETGKWQTSSTNILIDMWGVWPQKLKTWLIGDGMFFDPFNPKLYYMGTDVGYIRFLFFCGLPAFFIFVLFFVYIFRILKRRMPSHSDLLILLLILVFAVWVKVTTDIFFLFALLICVDSQNEGGVNKMGNR